MRIYFDKVKRCKGWVMVTLLPFGWNIYIYFLIQEKIKFSLNGKLCNVFLTLVLPFVEKQFFFLFFFLFYIYLFLFSNISTRYLSVWVFVYGEPSELINAWIKKTLKLHSLIQQMALVTLSLVRNQSK